jgi:hypothetical protein
VTLYLFGSEWRPFDHFGHATSWNGKAEALLLWWQLPLAWSR